MTTATPLPDRWTLRHAWHGDTDRAALALCRAELAAAGIEFAEAPLDANGDALKMHGFEIVDAVAAGHPRLVDLRPTALAEDWDGRLDPRTLRFMRHGAAMHGIPVAIHRSNCLWAHARTAAGAAPGGLVAWLSAAARDIGKPLAIGSEPWQIGLLFESLWLATLGADSYRRAFVELEPQELAGPRMIQALDGLLALREFVDDDRLALPWREQLANVRDGRSAVMAMGDWVGASLPAGVERVFVDGFRHECIHIVDFFVPARADAAAVSGRVAAVLTSTDFQARFSRVKGSLPAVLAAQGVLSGTPGRIDAPSLTFDQACPVRIKLGLLDELANHFLHRRSSAATARALAAIAAG